MRVSLRSVLAAALLPLALVLAALAGCGDDGGETTGPSASRPDDFAFTFAHTDGSVPPPYHAEWSVEVRPDGSGKATYTPDYSGDGVPTYRATFTVSSEDMDDIYERMRDAGLLEPIASTDEPPVGGSVESARIYADGETFDVPAFDEEGGSPLAPVSAAVQGLVPTADWDSFEARRAAYAKKEYGEAPPG
ncbi:MAG: hypothetical protein U0R24_00630 [Solirubrobacterales bacterium]